MSHPSQNNTFRNTYLLYQKPILLQPRIFQNKIRIFSASDRYGKRAPEAPFYDSLLSFSFIHAISARTNAATTGSSPTPI